jgi:hypothetical protein
MKSILDRMFKCVSDAQPPRNTFAWGFGERFDPPRLPERALDPYTVHAMCFPPPRYWPETTEQGRP